LPRDPHSAFGTVSAALPLSLLGAVNFEVLFSSKKHVPISAAVINPPREKVLQNSSMLGEVSPPAADREEPSVRFASMTPSEHALNTSPMLNTHASATYRFQRFIGSHFRFRSS
jgi:hypothetical protein